MTDATIRKSIYLRATPAKVWEYLTEPDKLAIWFHKPKSPLVEGDYAMYGTDSGDKLMWGEVLVADPFKSLEYTFSIAPMAGKSSTVRWALVEVAGGTRLSLEHDGLPDGEDGFGLLLALDKGWDDHIARMRASIHEE